MLTSSWVWGWQPNSDYDGDDNAESGLDACRAQPTHLSVLLQMLEGLRDVTQGCGVRYWKRPLVSVTMRDDMPLRETDLDGHQACEYNLHQINTLRLTTTPQVYPLLLQKQY